MTSSPGKILTTASDLLENISTGLFFVIGVTLIGKSMASIISILCFKILVPGAAVLYLLSLAS